MFKRKISSIILIAVPLITVIIALGTGRYSIPFVDVVKILASPITNNVGEISDIAKSLVLNSRLPRVITALLVGMGLATSGVAMQGLFSNPMATSDTIGVTSGASFGAVLGILMGGSAFFIQITAFTFGLLATLFTIMLSKISKNQSLIMVILSGMVVSSFFSALVSLMKTVADPESQLQSIVYWLMGSMVSASFDKLWIGAIFILAGVLVIYLIRWRLNIVSLSDDEAKSLGLPVKKFRLIILICSTLITASAVSMCGTIGWIGLLVPHLCRMLVGNNNVYLVPLSMSFGATFMIIVDTVARTMTPAEIPLSIITSLIGAPFFALLISKSGGKWR